MLNTRNGPKGTIASFFLSVKYKAYGKAKKDATNIYITPTLTPKDIPATNDSLTSPHPRDSCLKALSPKTFINSTSKNRRMPYRIW